MQNKSSGGLGVTHDSADDSKIALEIMPHQMRVGDEVFAVPQEDRLRRISEIQANLPSLMGLPVPEGNRLVMSDYDISKRYLASIDPDARGAEIQSAFQTAGFAGLPIFQIYPHSSLGYVRVPTAPGQENGLSQLKMSDTLLLVVLTSQAVEFWRRAAHQEGQAAQPLKKHATVSLTKLELGLANALEEQCANEDLACSPFFLNLQEDAKGSTLLAVLGAIESRPEFSAATSVPPRFVLLHGKVDNTSITPRSIRLGATSVNGRLPAEVIRKKVRESFGAYRKCYQQGLSRDEKLNGKVNVRFVIGRNGKVTNAAYAENSTMPDQAVSECVVTEFKKLEFPQPEGGIVKVTYPIMFAPE